jgi:tubulin--tyrosine ligase
LQISSYETLPFEHILSHSTTSIANAYIIRKALIRKHYLSTTAFNWTTKNPTSVLKTNIKPSCDFELDYAEFLDDALVEAWELQEAMQKNEEREAEDREWWILKPGMSDRGQGIRLFSTMAELQNIFEVWEADQPDSEEEEEEDDTGVDKDIDNDKDVIMTSHLRHFTAQPYIHPPLLIPSLGSRKFHIRTYVLALGSLSVYVYRPMLALFATQPYSPPWKSIDLSAHLTNTCLQPSVQDSTVHSFWSSSLPLSDTLKDSIFSQICSVTGEIFEAAAKGMMVHFQTLPNAFEVFGVDFLVDEAGTAWLLEINAFPDFKQTGSDLSGIVERLWKEVVRETVGGFFGGTDQKGTENLVLVRKVELGRR